MSDITMNVVKEKQLILVSEIIKLVKKFEEDTGVCVNDASFIKDFSGKTNDVILNCNLK